MFDFDAFIASSPVGKRVQIASWMDRWTRGDRFGTVIESDGSNGGMGLIYKVRMDKSGDVISIADTNFTLV